MRGFKAFNKDLTCRGFQYEISGTYKFDGAPIPCKQGFHFCKSIADCYKFYNMSDDTRICVVEAIGDIATDDEVKYCTNKIVILEEITEERERKGNAGSDNVGYCNSGDGNTGGWNTGNKNTGDYNTGNYNTGSRNTGNWNTGSRNTGDGNTGDWNTGSRNTGILNTETPLLTFFDKPSDWTYDQWLYSDARKLFNNIERSVVEWICEEDMTDEEKEQNPTYKTTGGYLKDLDEKESAQMWWDALSEEERQILRSLPNYDEEKFAKILGIQM